MAFSLIRPMFYLQDHDGKKAGQPVGRIPPVHRSMYKGLAANKVIGISQDLVALEGSKEEAPVAVDAPVVKEEAPKEPTPEVKDEVVEEVKEEEEEEAPVEEVKVKVKSTKKSNKRGK